MKKFTSLFILMLMLAFESILAQSTQLGQVGTKEQALKSKTMLLANDVGVEAILSPQTGYNLNTEIVTIKVKNLGTASQSNIPVSWSLNGGEVFTGIIKGPLLGNSTFNYTFTGFVSLELLNLSYIINACTNLEGDEFEGNDCSTNSVWNLYPHYCDCTTTTEDEYIANVLFGAINNSSGWQGGVADYTDQFTVIQSGESESITVTNGNAWASDIVYVWVDWNQDYDLCDSYEVEQYILTSVAGLGETFIGDITVPEGQACGAYRMRIRMTYNLPPTPGGIANYGEVEDYTLVVENVDFPAIQVNPTVLSQILYPEQTATQMPAVANSGGSLLNFDITIDTVSTVLKKVHQNNPNATTSKVIQNLSAPFIFPECCPVYCNAITTTEDEYIANVLFGNINNSSGWQDGIADFTNLNTIIEAGASENIIVTNGTPFSNDLVYAWVDWNKDFNFDASDEQYILNDPNGTGELFTGSVLVPENQPSGNYRVRIRMCYFTDPLPCGGSTYGEVEEYSIKVINNQTISWLSIEPMTGTLNPNHSIILNVNFDATGLQTGTYEGSIIINSNDPVKPFTTIPVTLIVGLCPLPPPLMLEGYENLPNIAYLSWEAPEIPGDLLGYNVYRNNDKINTAIITDLFYNDSLANPQQYFYFVTAVYPECEASSETISLVITGILENENDGLTIFPNPAQQILNIKSQNTINQISIMNNLGQVVFRDDFESLSVQINTYGLNKGIYVIQAKTEDGIIVKKLVIQ